ncbi:NADH-quinone oxidoreductase subunit J [Rhodoferax sp. 4810]|nr:NADH-quinone oxidoreductase subunit J [Rhodoferax jenense]
MDVKTGFFYAFSAILLFSAFRVITARNPVHAVLFLVLSFFQAAMIWMLLKAEFLSITLILVYVGAVMVLFLFVVMMLDINVDAARTGFWKHFPLAGVVGAVIIVEIGAVLLAAFPATEAQPTLALADPQMSNTRALGKLLYTQYLYPLEVAAALLLVAMIAAIALSLRQRKDSKAIDAGLQVRVRSKDRMKVIKMAPTLPARPVAPAEETISEKQA